MRAAASGLYGRWARTGGAGLFWLLAAGGLALAATGANGAPAAPVEAAALAPAAPAVPAAQVGTQVVERIHFSVTPPDRLCVGQSYQMPLSVLVDFQMGSGSQTTDFQDRVLPGVTVQASSDASAVASISPASAQSGALQVDLLIPPQFGSAKGMGQMVFTLHGKQAGTAILTFQATVPSRLGTQPAPIDLPIHVENCKYKVTVTGGWNVTYGNLVTRLTETLKGEMTRDDSGTLSGTANATWNLQSLSIMCSHAHAATPSKASLKGEQTGETLHFHLTYVPFVLKTVNCGSGTIGKIDVGDIEFIDFPASGASASTTLSFPVGNEFLIGAGTVSIVPVPLK